MQGAEGQSKKKKESRGEPGATFNSFNPFFLIRNKKLVKENIPILKKKKM